MRIRDKRRGCATIAVTCAMASAVAVVVSGCSGGGSDGSEGAESIVTPSARPRPSEANPVRPPRIGVAPPGTPYWHNRLLHVGDYEIKTRYRPVEVAGDTVLVGRNIGRQRATPWALLRNHELTPITAGSNTYPQLSFDGRIAYWSWRNSPQTTRYVVWDTETNRELASRDFEGHDAGFNGGPRLYIAGIDANGIAYVVDERSDIDVTLWDVRADTEEPAAGLTSADVTYADGLGVLHQDQFVSPDGTKEVFTGRAPGDSPPDCCATLLRVRPVGSDDPSDVVRLRLPEGVPVEPLWDAVSDEGTLGVWWETNQTVLLETPTDEHLIGQSFPSATASRPEYLVRCSTTDGWCEVVLELDRGGPWGFAKFPVTG